MVTFINKIIPAQGSFSITALGHNKTGLEGELSSTLGLSGLKRRLEVVNKSAVPARTAGTAVKNVHHST